MENRPASEQPRGKYLPERRSGRDRRGKPRTSLRSLLWGGRREVIRRQEDRQRRVYIDRYQQSQFAVVVLILFLSVTDAILTLLLISHGAVEINPIMAFYLGLGPYPFMFVKYAMTSTGLVVLVVFQRRFLKSLRMSAGAFLYVVLAAFLGVVSWEIYLIHRLIA